MTHYIHHQRLTEGKDYTIGNFRITGSRIRGYFLEPGGPSTKESGKDRRIPPGTYDLVWHSGDRFRGVLKLYNADVPVERAILIHGGNRGKDTEGCLLPGTVAGGDYVTHSRDMLQAINKFVRKVGIKNVKVVITEISSGSAQRAVA
ncbi:MAG: hypothetical protein JST41_09185 [Bacteroidetes bacterium]|jgi:hypothetical protein|nr:hypothetical protein [Bacteroidota bacterium]MBX7127715.1 hypothetical protein [Flavobacteriales bacterium]MCC6654739.1 hypothetical protein [Flavobacteriales bacterium]HMU14819.1 DUF5675 family protein [Flavobacteriales bacterium]HMW96118.1 DUF5675 family protein [Flavobacteriales bacterium]